MDLCRLSVCDRASLRVVRRFACLRVEICAHVRSLGRATVTHCARASAVGQHPPRPPPRISGMQKRAQILTTDGREQVDPRRRGRHVHACACAHACARQYARAHATSRSDAHGGLQRAGAKKARPAQPDHLGLREKRERLWHRHAESRSPLMEPNLCSSAFKMRSWTRPNADHRRITPPTG